MGEVAEHPIVGDGEAIGHRIEDPLVGLVQQQPVEIGGAQPPAGEQLGQDRRHLAHGELVDLLAVHANWLEAAHLGREPIEQGAVLVHLGQGEAAIAAAIGAHAEGEQAILRCRAALQGHGAGAVAEEHAGAAVLPVHPAAQLVGADHQGAAHRTTAQVVGGGDQGEEEAAAGGREIEGHGVHGAEGGLHPWGGAEEVVGAGGGQQDEIKILGPPAGMGESRGRGGGGQLGEGFLRARHPAGADAGAGADPGVAGVDPAAQVVVADAAGGYGAAAAHQGNPRLISRGGA